MRKSFHEKYVLNGVITSTEKRIISPSKEWDGNERCLFEYLIGIY